MRATAVSDPQARWFERDRLQVKFSDRHKVRLRRGVPADSKGKALVSKRARAVLATLADAQWLQLHHIGAAKLDKLRAEGPRKSKSKLPDLANWYLVMLPRGLDAFDVAAQLHELPEVEYVRPMRKPVPPPTAPDFTVSRLSGWQAYLDPAPLGVDAAFAWARPGGDGDGVTVCDVEYEWLFSHIEFGGGNGIEQIGGPFIHGIRETSHGTAVVSIFGGRNDGEGVKGIAHACTTKVSTVVQLTYNVASALSAACAATVAGDVILIEVQTVGPDAQGQPLRTLGGWSQEGMVPVEWDRGVYDVVKDAVERGERIVVEAAGNGSENLDRDVFRKEVSEGLPFWRTEIHEPFTRANDSGAIMVGADSGGRGGGGGDHVRANFSNWGSRVDVHSWGATVIAAASDDGDPSSDLFRSDGPNAGYTRLFNGTSSAAAIVAGVCASLQGIFKKQFGRPMTPAEMRDLLVRTGTRQIGDQHIGPQPDLKRAIEALDAEAPGQPTLDPPGGAVQLPARIRVSPRLSGAWLNNPSIWYSLDGSWPQEGGATSILLCAGAQCHWPPPIEFNTVGNMKLRVGMFADSPTYGGTRQASPIANAQYDCYVPVDGPALEASLGKFGEYVKLEWVRDSAAVSGYELYTGLSSPHRLLATLEANATEHEDRTAPDVGAEEFYWIRARHENGRFSRFSGPVVGWRRGQPLGLTADSSGVDHVHLEWSAPPWPYRTDLEYRVFRATSGLTAFAVQIATIEPTSRRVETEYGSFTLPVEPVRFHDDREVREGQLYFYWVRAFSEYQNLSTPFGTPVAGGAFARLATREHGIVLPLDPP